MGSYSIGEALDHLFERSHWKPKMIALRMSNEWEAITGRAIAKYTRSVDLREKTLIIYTDVAPLKQELQYGREALIERINEYFGEQVIEQIIIK